MTFSRGRSRYRHRSQQHADAHAQGAAAAVEYADHPLATRESPRLIARAAELDAFVAELRAAGSFAFDTEFIGELNYFPRICLIQAATSKVIGLIDPLAGLDVTPFWDLVADGAVEKIVHAGQQDVEPAFRALGRPAANLFDTQVAAGFLGLGYPLSLSKIVYLHLRARLNKSLTFTDWERRPLSEAQLRYAADDVRYLPALRDEMGRGLEALGHTAWAREESNALADASLYVYDAAQQWTRLKGAALLPARHQAVARELMGLRDAAARKQDVPARALLKDEIVIELARHPADSVAALEAIAGFPRPVAARYGAAIVEATQRALALPPAQWPDHRSHEPNPPEKFREDALFAAAECLATGRQIEPTLVFNRAEIGELHRRHNAGKDASSLRMMKGWRAEAIGRPLRALLEGGAAFHLTWRDGHLVVSP